MHTTIKTRLKQLMGLSYRERQAITDEDALRWLPQDQTISLLYQGLRDLGLAPYQCLARLIFRLNGERGSELEEYYSPERVTPLS